MLEDKLELYKRKTAFLEFYGHIALAVLFVGYVLQLIFLSFNMLPRRISSFLIAVVWIIAIAICHITFRRGTKFSFLCNMLFTASYSLHLLWQIVFLLCSGPPIDQYINSPRDDPTGMNKHLIQFGFALEVCFLFALLCLFFVFIISLFRHKTLFFCSVHVLKSIAAEDEADEQ